MSGTRRIFTAGSKLAALGAAVVLLTGCFETIAQGMVESDMRAEHARIAAQGNPTFPDPALNAMVTEFEADYARFERNWDGLIADGTTPCRMDPAQAYQVINQMAPDEMQQYYAPHGMTFIIDFDSLELHSVSGPCPEQGIDGPVELVGKVRTITRFGQGDFVRVNVTDTASRITGTFQDGKRHGPVRDILITRNITFEPGDDGALKAQEQDWEFLREMSESPTGTYVYRSYGEEYKSAPSMTFIRNPSLGMYSTSVEESQGGDLRYSRTYVGTELRNEGGLKDGKQHGWQISHPYTSQGYPMPGSRRCLQNGEEIKATVCPFE